MFITLGKIPNRGKYPQRIFLPGCLYYSREGRKKKVLCTVGREEHTAPPSGCTEIKRGLHSLRLTCGRPLPSRFSSLRCLLRCCQLRMAFDVTQTTTTTSVLCRKTARRQLTARTTCSAPRLNSRKTPCISTEDADSTTRCSRCEIMTEIKSERRACRAACAIAPCCACRCGLDQRGLTGGPVGTGRQGVNGR